MHEEPESGRGTVVQRRDPVSCPIGCNVGVRIEERGLHRRPVEVAPDREGAAWVEFVMELLGAEQTSGSMRWG